MIDDAVEHGETVTLRWGGTAVTLLARFPQAAIAQLFASFDVLLAPSVWPESYGLVTREADFYGKWIVASHLGGIGVEVEEGRTGFKVDVTRTDDLARVLGMMNDDVRRFKRRPARATPIRSADDQARELVAIYRGLRRTGYALEPKTGLASPITATGRP